jgi:hypothetical protein
MGVTPGAHPLHIRRTPEVVPVGPLAQPTALAGGLAGTTTLRLGAVVLMAQIAWVGEKQFSAVSALTSSVAFHWCALRFTPMIGKPRPAVPTKRPHQVPAGYRERRWKKTKKRKKGTIKENAEEEQKKMISTDSNRPSGYSFRTALTPRSSRG